MSQKLNSAIAVIGIASPKRGNRYLRMLFLQAARVVLLRPRGSAATKCCAAISSKQPMCCSLA
jgi:hypothetical protein